MIKRLGLTQVTDHVVSEIRDASDNPIYDMESYPHPEIHRLFHSQYDGYSPRNGLVMRAILAGDILIVNHSKTKYFLILATELPELEKKPFVKRACFNVIVKR